jgi:hypothetical protein
MPRMIRHNLLTFILAAPVLLVAGLGGGLHSLCGVWHAAFCCHAGWFAPTGWQGDSAESEVAMARSQDAAPERNECPICQTLSRFQTACLHSMNSIEVAPLPSVACFWTWRLIATQVNEASLPRGPPSA